MPIKPEIYADASNCIHPRGQGHGGISITLGSAPIHFKLLLNELGFPLPQPITVYPDNQSTILLVLKGAETLNEQSI